MGRKHLVHAMSAVAAACAAMQLVLPDESRAATQQEATGSAPVDIRAWNTSNLYEGWSAKALLREPVYGTGGQVLGEVSDLLIGSDGVVQRVVVEGGGVRETKGTLFAVPWNAAKRISSAGIDVPVSEGNLSGYGRFPKLDELPSNEGTFRLAEMIGDPVKADGTDYGTIRDVIFDRNDRAAAIIVIPAPGAGAPSGPIAFPYNPDYYETQKSYYSSPYPRERLKELRPFEYDRLE